jgi:TonB family protein
MNALATMIAIVACSTMHLHNPAQASFAGQQSSPEMEKRAVADTQQILAQDLDPELPRLPFATWFKQLAGPRAGIVWQLSECGDAPSPVTGEIRACVEANTILPDGRRVILMLTVGTFKRGVTGTPAFQFGVIEQEGELRTIRRLRDLQKQLLAPRSLVNTSVKLPEANIPKIRLSANNAYADVAPAWGGEEFGRATAIEAPPPPAPPRARLALSKTTSDAENQDASEEPGRTTAGGEVMSLGDVAWGDVIKKVQPRYPAQAKRVNASGSVNVQITISETGRVIEAKGASGHPLLRDAAVTAARQWVFKPAILNGVPVKTETVLVFVFTVPN